MRSFSPDSAYGFVLVSCALLMVLLVLLAVGMLRLSSIETRHADRVILQEKARANARLALLLAITQLQETTGQDQVVTANADILSSDQTTVSNKNWVGAWRTTYQVNENDINWPLIGRRTDQGNDIYSYIGRYSDLRNTETLLTNRSWRNELLNGWLVSSSTEDIDPTEALDAGNDNVLEILGRGSLGESMEDKKYASARVLVQKMEVSGDSAIAWWTADNSVKANIKPYLLNDLENKITTSPGVDLKFIKLENEFPFEGFRDKALEHRDKFISTGSAYLVEEDSDLLKESLRHYVHDLTLHSPSMFIDTAHGGFQRDLTPLLFAKKSEKVIDFLAPSKRISDTTFSSDYPIITSKYHDVLAPTFSALRYWGLQRYNTGNAVDTVLASGANRFRTNTSWPHQQSDGVTFNSTEWGSEMPKTHPIMTDSRWHYYFSINENRIRTHIIPRVCLWNPYNIEMKINDMIVMMPNPFYKGAGGFHFYFEEQEVERVQAETSDLDDHIHDWIQRNASPLGLQFKSRLLVKDLFPNTRYLAFTLRSTTLAAGECHVFSPSVPSSQSNAGGVSIAQYEEDSISMNVLSSDVAQGGDHFYFDMPSMSLEVQVSSGWRTLSQETQDKLNLEMVHDYRAETGELVDNFPFILKASNGDIPNLTELLESEDHPTLQLINNGTGGVVPTYFFSFTGSSWGSANTISSFGSLQSFEDAPFKDAPVTHQVGAKLCWLDESTTEGNLAPLRYGNSSTTRWTADHMVYHPATIANWNIRAQLTTRSPISQCAKHWYLFSTGPWLLQFVPKSPQDMNDSPQLNSAGTAFVKNPLGLSIKHAHSPNVVLFDLPHRDYGIHSIAAMRHAMLSPYSWHPSYIIGHSLRDPHSPTETTVHPEVVETIESTNINHWDVHIGGHRAGYGYGAANEKNDSGDLLQIGESAVSRDMNSSILTSADDILPYDIAFEVNQGIWDSYFVSSLPLNADTDKFSSIIPENQRYVFNPHTNISSAKLEADLTSENDAVDKGFWLNGYYYRRDHAFNVNSTSIPAWTAFLSSTLEVKRELRNGSEVSNGLAGFSRFRRPEGVSNSDRLHPENTDSWKGLRSLTEEEIGGLATTIVDEVKLRGPFISIADFVNRRLTHREDETSYMGALDAAILKAGLNESFYEDDKYNTTTVNRGKDNDSVDNNQEIFREDYLYTSDGEEQTSMAATKTWGLPSFLMQSDLLEPLAPALTTRGDTFTIRAYGEVKNKGLVVARAYIEAIVERSPHYVQHQKIGDDSESNEANIPTDRAIKIDPLTGKITEGNLTEINMKLGRKYQIRSFRWLNKDEI